VNQQHPNNFQNSNGHSVAPARPQEELEALDNDFDYKKIFFQLIDNWKIITVSLLIAFAIAYSLNRYTTPVYVVKTSLLISEPRESNTSASDYLFGNELFGKNVTNLENETYLLRSYTLIDKTLRDLKLEVSYFKEGDIKNAELYRDSPIKVTLPSYTKSVMYNFPVTCIILNDKKYALEIEESSFFDKVKLFLANKSKRQIVNIFEGMEFRFGEVVKVGEFAFKIDYDKTKNRAVFDNRVQFVIHKYKDLTKIYRSEVKIALASEEASILNISVEGTTPKKAKDFLDALVRNYMDNELNEKNNIALRTIDFINDQIINMSDSLKTIENQLEKFKRTNAPISISEESSKLFDNSQQMEQDRSELMLSNKYLSDLSSYVSNDNLEQIFTPSSLGINDPSLNTSVSELIKLQLDNKLMEADNPYVIENRRKIDQIKSKISQDISSLKLNNEYRVNDLNSRLSRVNYSLRAMPTAEREFVNIQRTYDLRENLYLFLMQKKAEAGIAKASNTVDYRLIDAAKIEGLLPIKPSPMLNYAIALFLGLLIPLAFIFIADMLNDKVNSKEDIAKYTSMPFLGMVAGNKANRELIVEENAKSATAETIRSVRSNLRYLTQGKQGCITFLVTSSFSGEGKTFCAKNLSYIFSNFGKKVLYINADMRKKNSFVEFGIEDELTKGLSDYLAGIYSKEEIILKTDFDNLSIIKSGKIPPNPSELLIGDKFDSLLTELKADYDYIILDTPPIGIISDGIELMAKADVNIFVIRQDVTLKAHVKEIDHLYSTGQVRDIAILFNDVSFKRMTYGYGYYVDPDDNPWWWKKYFGRDKEMWGKGKIKSLTAAVTKKSKDANGKENDKAKKSKHNRA